MANDTMRVKVPMSVGVRPRDLAGWLKWWSEEEAVEVFNRYCDIKDREAKYRLAGAAKVKAVKAWVKAQGVDVEALVKAQMEEEEEA